MTEGPTSKIKSYIPSACFYLKSEDAPQLFTITEKAQFLQLLSKTPNKSIVFVTIKCNTQLGVWMKLGKANDWIRKYSKHYALVRGTEGGTHFHMLAIIHKTPQFIKNIHFNLGYFRSENKVPLYIKEQVERDRDDKNKSIYFYEQERSFRLPKLALLPLGKIVKMIQDYWNSNTPEERKEARTLKRTQREIELIRIMDYLQKNLDEPREHTVERYTDYITTNYT